MPSRQMIGLVMLGYAVAVPVAWVSIRAWSTSFAHAVPISVGWILVGGLLLVLLAVVTSGQRWRARRKAFGRSRPFPGITRGACQRSVSVKSCFS